MGGAKSFRGVGGGEEGSLGWEVPLRATTLCVKEGMVSFAWMVGSVWL